MKRPTKNTTRNDFCLSSINTNDDYDEDDDEDECDDFFLDYCAPDDDALLTRITRGDDHTAERYGIAIDCRCITNSDPVEYYAEALADVETLVRFFLYLFSLSFSLFSRRNERRGQGEMRKSALQSREARASRVGGRYNRQSSRASFSRLSMDDVDDGFVRNSKFRAGK